MRKQKSVPNAALLDKRFLLQIDDSIHWISSSIHEKKDWAVSPTLQGTNVLTHELTGELQ